MRSTVPDMELLIQSLLKSLLHNLVHAVCHHCATIVVYCLGPATVIRTESLSQYQTFHPPVFCHQLSILRWLSSAGFLHTLTEALWLQWIHSLHLEDTPQQTVEELCSVATFQGGVYCFMPKAEHTHTDSHTRSYYAVHMTHTHVLLLQAVQYTTGI